MLVLDEDWFRLTLMQSQTNLRRKASDGASALMAFIVGRLDDGTWSAGDKLPTERELQVQFGIARNTLRRSLVALEKQGRITRHVGRGTFVSGQEDRGGAGELERRIHQSSPAEIMDVRLLIEPQAIEVAAGRATGDDIAFMLECLTRSEAATTIAEFEDWDGALHERMMGAAGNALLSDIYAVVSGVRKTAAWGKLKERSLTPQRRALYERQHRSVVNALRERDAEMARQMLCEHLIAVRDNLLGVGRA
jgi:DNA-binding FadR family transcriptional regulator